MAAFSSAQAYVRANRTFFLFVLLLVVSLSGYMWWRADFTFDISRFFASEDEPLCVGDGQGDPTGDSACEQYFAESCEFGWCDENCSVRRSRCDDPPVEPSSPPPPSTGCANAADPWTYVWTVTDEFDSVQDGTYFSPIAGCAPTTEISSGGGSYTSDGGNPPTFTFRWDPTEGSQCGRYQYDAFFFQNGQRVTGVGVVFNWGVDCGAQVSPTEEPTPPPTTPPPALLQCVSTVTQANIGQMVPFSATGGTGTYAWFAPGGAPATGAGVNFSTSYALAGFKTVTVVSGGNQAACMVQIATPPPTSPPPTSPPPTSPPPTSPPPTSPPPTSPPPTSPPATSPRLSVQKVVRNVSAAGSEQESVNAEPAQTVEFAIRISSTGSGTANQVVVRDTLPAGLTYQGGTTTVDNASAADGIIGSGLALGDMPPGRTITVRFRALVAPEQFFGTGTTTLVNTAFVRASNVPEISDIAVVTVTRSAPGLSMSLTKLGRNLTRGETDERTLVEALPVHIIEFVIRARNTSATTLTNVRLRDVVPSGITFVPGTVRLGGQVASDTFVTSGLLVGSLVPGQEAVVTFHGRIANAADLPTGTTTFTNTAYSTADNVPQLSAQLPVIVTRPTTPVTQVPTGPGETTVLALIISAVITLLYVGYASTDAFRRHEAGSLARQEHDHLDFRR